LLELNATASTKKWDVLVLGKSSSECSNTAEGAPEIETYHFESANLTMTANLTAETSMNSIYIQISSSHDQVSTLQITMLQLSPYKSGFDLDRTGIIIGFIFGLVALVFAVALITYLVYKKTFRRSRAQYEEVEQTSSSVSASKDPATHNWVAPDSLFRLTSSTPEHSKLVN